tara:strand:- start:800 stop:946 length:147 start_codon:yes stop_codon:yes gene_type:complete
MTVQEQHKINVLKDLRDQLDSVMSIDDKDTYPCLLHLDDLIDDLEMER